MNLSFVSRKFRKSIAGFTILALLTSFVSFAGVAQAGFSDTAGHWAESFIDDLVDQGVLSGYEDGTFGPDDTLTRAQISKIAVLAFLGEGELDSDYDAGFVDVSSTEWFSSYVNTAAKHGIVGGYTDADGDTTGYFGPNDTVNRAQAAKIIVGAAGLSIDTTGAPHFGDVAAGTWFHDFVETAYNNSVVDGYTNGNFGPADPVTRAQAAKISVNAQNPTPRTDDGGTTTPPAGGDGTLSIVSTSMSGGTVPKSATAVPMLGLELTANGDDMTLDELTLTRKGVGSTSDFSNLYFFHGSERIGSGRSISTDTNEAVFTGLNVDVDEGDTEMVWIKADYSSTASAANQNYFQVTSASDASVSGGGVSGSFPVMGPTFSVGGATAGTITIEKNSTVSNPTIGEADAEIANFRLTAANEDMSLESLALTFKGSINGDAGSNFQLLQNGEVLATTNLVNADDLFTFDLDSPYEIEKGDSRVFSVTAKIGSTADADDTVRVYLDENTDLVAVGDVYGYGAAVASGSYDNGSNDGTDANWSTVQGGKFTVAFNGPAAFNYSPNQKDVNFLDLTFTAGRDVEVRQLAFTIAATGSGLIDDDGGTANYTDIKLKNLDTGSTLMGPKELSTSGGDSQVLTFTQSWYLDAGESINAGLTMDVANETGLDTTPSVVTVTMSAISTTEGVKDTGTGEFITDLVPSTSIAGYGHTAQDASLAVALASSPVSDTVVKGTKGVTLAGFVFTAGDASDVKITKIQPTVAFSLEDSGAAGTWSVTGSTGSTTYAKELATTLYLYDDNGVQIGDTEAVPNGGKVTFDSLSLTVPAGETTTVWVKGDIATTAPAEGTTDVLGVDIEATGDVTAEDEDANSVTLAAADPNGSTDANATTVAWTVSAGGTIVVSQPSSQVNDKLVAAGSTSVLIGRFKVKATDEDFNVDKLRLDATTSGYEDNFQKVTIKYPTSLAAPTTLDGSTTKTFSGTAVTFSNLEFKVPADNDNVVFEIYADVNSHADDSGAADTGDNLQMTIYPYASSFEATGIGSGASKDGATSGVLSSSKSTNKAYVFKTIPTVTLNSSTSNSIVYGENEILRFTVGAGSNGDLALLGLRLKVSHSGIVTGATGLGGGDTAARGAGTANAWKMYELGNESVQVGSGEFVYSATEAKAYVDIYDNTTDWGNGNGSFEQVTAGGSTTYIVKATITDDGVDNTNSVSTQIAQDSTADFANTAYPTIGTPLTGDLAEAGFIWSDRPNASGFGTAGTTGFWHNGYKVTGLPTTFVTFSS